MSMLIFAATVFFINPVFAERNITFEKVVDINREALQETLMDIEVYTKIFPENIKSIESLTYEDKNLAEMKLGLNGFFINSEIEYLKDPYENYIIEITSGNLKGTKFITTLNETWGFDGTPTEGTIVTIDLTLQFSGFPFLMSLVSDESILYSMDKFLDSIVLYTKSNTDEPTQTQNQNQPLDDLVKESKISKKGHRKR